jgi:hypothetical protein
LIEGENIMTNQTESAIFDTNAEAQRAVADLRDAGVPNQALSVVTPRGGVTATADVDGEVAGEDHGSVVRGILGGGALAPASGLQRLRSQGSVL